MLDQLLAQIGNEESRDVQQNMTDLAVEAAIQHNQERYALFAERYHFKPGDNVRAKKGLNCFKFPNNQPLVVVDILEKTIPSNGKPGSNTGSQPKDIRCGFVDDDGDFMVYAFDSRYFQPYGG